MTKRTFSKIGVLILLLFLFGGGIVWQLTKKKTPDYEIKEDMLTVNLSGYTLSCSEPLRLYVQEADSWRETTQYLPLKGMYYLDGEYYGYKMCDVMICNKIDNPINIKLTEYKKIGEKESLETKDYLVPEYQTVNLSGKIKIEYEYFTDKNCKNKKIFSTIINK